MGWSRSYRARQKALKEAMLANKSKYNYETTVQLLREMMEGTDNTDVYSTEAAYMRFMDEFDRDNHSAREIKNVQGYTYNDYSGINKALRDGMPSKYDIATSAMAQKINDIERVLSSYELPSDRMFYRSEDSNGLKSLSDMVGFQVTPDNIGKIVGKEFTNPAFGSTSAISPLTSTGSLNNNGFGNVHASDGIDWYIKGHQGQKMGVFIGGESAYGPQEGEYLTRRNMRYKAESAYYDPDLKRYKIVVDTVGVDKSEPVSRVSLKALYDKNHGK